MAYNDNSFADMLLTLPMSADRTELVQVLSPSEFASLSSKCDGNTGMLIGRDIGYIMNTLECTEQEAYRICMLLSRAMPLSYHLEQLNSCGISIMTIHDDSYPEELKTDEAPPAVYVCGNTELLDTQKIAVFGISGVKLPPYADVSISYLTDFCVRTGYTLLSGGEAGACAYAEKKMLEKGGSMICFLSGGMKDMLFAEGYSEAIANGSCLVLQCVHPDAPKTLPHAKARNRYMFGLARASYVFTTDCKRFEPEAVRGKDRCGAIYAMDTEKPEGNRQLIARGAIPFTALDGNVIHEMQRSWTHDTSEQMSLF